MSNDESADRKLVDFFTEGFRIFDEFDNRQDATNGDTYQVGRILESKNILDISGFPLGGCEKVQVSL